MKPELIVENAIAKTQSIGIKIVRGPMLIWGHNGIIEGCNCSGAVLIAHDKAIRPLPKGWLTDLCVNILGEDTYWWWRFSFGFNQGRVLEVFDEDHGIRRYFEDDVSKKANRLARNLGLYPKR